MSDIIDPDESPGYSRGLRDAARDATIQQHAERLDTINGSLVQIAQSSRALEARLQKMEVARERETAVSEALSKHLTMAEALEETRRKTQITSRQLLISVIAIIVPVLVSIIVAVIISGGLH